MLTWNSDNVACTRRRIIFLNLLPMWWACTFTYKLQYTRNILFFSDRNQSLIKAPNMLNGRNLTLRNYPSLHFQWLISIPRSIFILRCGPERIHMILNVETLKLPPEITSFESAKWIWCLLLPILFILVLEFLDKTVMQEKNKGIRTRKEKTKLSLFTMIWLCW